MTQDDAIIRPVSSIQKTLQKEQLEEGMDMRKEKDGSKTARNVKNIASNQLNCQRHL